MSLHTQPLSRAKQSLVRSLLAKRSERYKQKLFVMEGLRAVIQALSNRQLELSSVILRKDYLDAIYGKAADADQMAGYATETLKQLFFQRKNLALYTLDAATFQRLSQTENTQGVMALCRIPEPVKADEMLSGDGVILCLDRIRDPGNLGTMIRTATWFGMSGLVLSRQSVDLFGPKVTRSAAGATGYLPWLEADLGSFLKLAARKDWLVHLLEARAGAVSYRSCRPTGRDILVVGSEASGISRSVRDAGYGHIAIPTGLSDPESGLQADTTGQPGVESLNASVAASIVMAHFATSPRQG